MKTISRYIMTLALLLTAVTGAWATDDLIIKELTVPSEWNNDKTYLTVDEMTGFKDFSSLTDDEAKALLNSVPAGNVIIFYGAGASSNSFKFVQSNEVNVEVGENPVPHENIFSIKNGFKFYYTASDAIEVTPGSSANTWTFNMPGSDVVLTPIYAKAATFATTGTGTEATPLLPAAAEGVIAGTDASLIAEGTGIVAFAGTSTEVTQGTLMYAIGTSATEAPALTAFSATVPTAKDYDDAATLYVWYYIQGADAPDGVAATLDNTFNDTEPACLTVTVLTNKFDITLKAANANTIEAGKATVTVGGTDKTAAVTDGKLQAVKMGSEVKLEANPGYKFRKVEVKKNMPPSLTSATTDDVGKLVATDGSLFATADEVTAAGKTAAAMVAYVSSTGHGLAIALSNEDSYPRYSNAGSTAAAHQPVVTGHAWSLPTKEDWQNMIIGCGYTGGASDNMQISGLKTKLSAVGSSLPDGFYWTGSMADATYVWQFSPDGNNGSFSSSVQSDSESELAVRAVLAF